MRQPMVAGNWKMNGSSESIAELLSGIKSELSDTANAAVVVCPSSVYLSSVLSDVAGTKIQVGAQNLCDEDAGAFTGEVSGSMLADLSLPYVLVGHSERRSLYGESNKMVALKFKAAQRHGLTPILCVGESLEEREAGVTEDVVARQIDAIINSEGIDALANSVIAYEPVWAIGTGKTASPEQAQAVHQFIREKIAAENADIADKMQILYGGSVNSGNAVELFSQTDIDGGLVGGASLKADEFNAIIKAAG